MALWTPPNALIRLRFEIQGPVDAMTGIVVSPDQGNSKNQIKEVTIDGDDFSLSLKRPKAKFVGKLSADRKTIEGSWEQGKSTPLTMRRVANDAEFELPPAKEVWKGSIQTITKLEVQIRVVEDPESKEERCYFDSLSQGAMGIKAKLSREDGKLIIEVPAVSGRFEGVVDEAGRTAKGKWAQGFFKLPMEIERVDEVSVAFEFKRPQHPKEPFGYKVEDVRFPSLQEGVTLAGTLTMPHAVDSKENQPLTAAILISGSGPQDRDESLMGHKPFLVIADHLTKKGVAVLRFDDRGTAESTGDHETATTVDFANDVRGAVAYLRSRPEIASKRIGLVGHSEGGLIGPLVTKDDHDVAFLVLLAGPGVNGEKIILNQSMGIARAAGESESTLALQQKWTPKLVDAVKSDADEEQVNELIEKFASELLQQALKENAETQANAEAAKKSAVESESDTTKEEADPLPSQEDLEESLMGGRERMSSPWFRFFLTHEPLPALEQSTCPILSLIGEKDLQVDPKLNNEPLRAALKKAGNAASEHRELPGLNHLFQECETGAISEYQEIEQTFSPVALEAMSKWILGLDFKK